MATRYLGEREILVHLNVRVPPENETQHNEIADAIVAVVGNTVHESNYLARTGHKVPLLGLKVVCPMADLIDWEREEEVAG